MIDTPIAGFFQKEDIRGFFTDTNDVFIPLYIQADLTFICFRKIITDWTGANFIFQIQQGMRKFLNITVIGFQCMQSEAVCCFIANPWETGKSFNNLIQCRRETFQTMPGNFIFPARPPVMELIFSSAALPAFCRA